MIRKYRIGNPIPTDCCVTDIPVSHASIPYFERNDEAKELSYTLSKKDKVFGLGESIRGINKRGWLYISNNSDDPNHTENKHSLYASQNFFVIYSGERQFGVFVDTPGKVSFDIGYTSLDNMTITFEDFDADIYIIEEENVLATVAAFRKLIGRSYIPPKWSFGFGQSRWSYMNEDEVREVADGYEKLGIPLDMIYLDIDYMERYKDFTVDEKAFPEFPKFVEEMKNRGIHLVPIIDAGVKIEEGYDVYEEGVKNDYFVKKENGENLVAAVWPGKVHFPDFLKTMQEPGLETSTRFS